MADGPAVARGSVLLTPKFENLTKSISDQLSRAMGGAGGAAEKGGSQAGSRFASGFAAKAATSGMAKQAVSTAAAKAAAAAESGGGASGARFLSGLSAKLGGLSSALGAKVSAAASSAGGTADAGGSQAGSRFAAGFAAKAGAVAGLAQAAVAKACSAVSSALDSAISRVDTMNNFPRVMSGLGYSADDASSAIQKMSDHLTGLPTRLDAMTSSVQQIVPTVKDVGKSTDIMLAFNDALLAGGAATSVQESALEQFGQVLAKGKPELEDWRSIQTAMPGQLDQLAQSMLGAGASSTDLYNAMKEGSVSVEDLENAFIALDQNGYAGFDSFAEQARNGTAGIATSMANLQNSVVKAVAKVIDALGVENITAPMDAAKSAVSGAADFVAGKIEWAKGLLGSVADGVDQGKLAELGSAFGRVGDAIGGIAGKIGGFASGLAESGAASGAINSALDAMAGAAGMAAAALGFVCDNMGTIGPLLVAAAAGFSAFQAATGVMSALSLAQKGVAAAQALVNAVMAANPFVAVVVAVAAVAAGLVALWNTNEGFREAVVSAWDAISGAASAVWGAIVEFFTATIPGAIQGALEWFAQLPENIGLAIQGAIEWVSQLPANIAALLGAAIGFVAEFAVTLGQHAIEAGSSFLSNVVEFFSQLPGNVASFLANAVSSIGQFAQNAIAKAGEAGQGFLDGVSSGFTSAIDFIGSIPGRVMDFFGNVGSWLYDSGKALLDGFVNGITAGFSAARQAVDSGLSTIREFFPFSPAKRGPFSGRGYTTHSGAALMQGLASGLDSAAPLAAKSAAAALNRVRGAMECEPIAYSASASVAAASRLSAAASSAADGSRLTKQDIASAVLVALRAVGLRVEADAETIAVVLAPYIDDELGRRKDMGL